MLANTRAVAPWLRFAVTSSMQILTAYGRQQNFPTVSFLRMNESCNLTYSCTEFRFPSRHPLEGYTLQRFRQQFLPVLAAWLSGISLRIVFCTVRSVRYVVYRSQSKSAVLPHSSVNVPGMPSWSAEIVFRMNLGWRLAITSGTSASGV